MISTSLFKKTLSALLLISLAGSGLALAVGAKAAPGAQTPQLSAQDLDETAQRIALLRWREYMRNIGWPADQVQATHPAFVDAIASKERLAAGEWRFVLDGTRTGEIRMVTLELDDRGNEVGHAIVEWSDVCTIEDIQGVGR